MKIIVFDTETTGIPSNQGSLEEQPHICQFAAILYEFDEEANVMVMTELERMDQLFKPPVIIPADCVIIHGITDAMVADQPVFGEFADKVLDMFAKADVAVGHNLGFDQLVIENELKRLERGVNFMPAQSFDTMREMKEICRIPGRLGKIKSPRLGELHKFLFNEEMQNAHNAMFDVFATARCLEELAKRGIFKPQAPEVQIQDSLF